MLLIIPKDAVFAEILVLAIVLFFGSKLFSKMDQNCKL